MKVLVNALPLRFGGGVTYLQDQLRALALARPDWELHTLAAPWTEGVADLPGTVETVALRSVAARTVYEQVGLPRRRADVVYCPANFGPLRHRDPVVLTVHNPNYYGRGLTLPDTRASRPWSKVTANHWSVRTADVVVAISQSIADELTTTLPGVVRDLRVVPSGAASWSVGSEAVDGLPERFVAVIGSMAPHKRVPEAVTAWSRSVSLAPSTAASLVVVGPMAESNRAACLAAAGVHADRVVFTGQLVRRGQMRFVYEHALALVSSSMLEAFPLTPGEAGSVGCPLVLSDIPPHREVTSGHGIFFAAGSPDALATVLVSEVYAAPLDRTPWTWPVTWEDNARAFAAIFEEMAR